MDLLGPFIEPREKATGSHKSSILNSTLVMLPETNYTFPPPPLTKEYELLEEETFHLKPSFLLSVYELM